ncbi:MAG: hypothetical protein QW703_00970 [Candidatus Aenigmatarchaeota archaeon]
MGIFDIFKKRPKLPEKPFQPIKIETTDKGSFDDFYKSMLSKSLIILITGKRGSGKSALGMSLLETIARNTKRRCYALGYDMAKLPKWIKKIENLEDVPENSVALVDEGAIVFFSREAMKEPNKVLSKIMAIARHKNLSLILIAQSSAMIDLNVIRLADVIMLKEPSLLQAKFERKAIREMYEKVEPLFKKVTEREKYFYVWSDDFEGMASFDLPTFWSEGISKAFKKIK